MKKRIFALVFAVCLMVAAITGCGCSSKTSEGETLDGKVTLAGSTSMEKLCEALSEMIIQG